MGVTRYLQLYTLLARQLTDGAFEPHKALPSEPHLVARYGVSRTTVRRALERLEQEGRIVRRRGSGTFLKKRAKDTSLSCSLQAFCDPSPPALRKASDIRLHSAVQAVPQALRNIHSELGAQALALQRVRSHQGEPFQVEVLYLREVMALPRSGAVSPARLLSKINKLRRRIDIVEQSIAAIAADDCAARHLQVSFGTPLLRLRIAFKNANGELIAVKESLFRSDRLRLHATLERTRKAGPRAAWRLKFN